MPAGIEITNTSGTVLINDQDPSLALKSKVSLTTDGAGSASTTFTLVEFPVVAFSCTALTRCYLSYSGTSVTANFLSSPSTGITVYLFDRPVETTLGYGLQVFAADGKCCFDSNQKYGRVVNVMSGETTYTGSKTHAVVITNTRYQEYVTNVSYDLPGGGVSEFITSWDRYILQSAARVNGTSVTVELITTDVFIGEEPEFSLASPPDTVDLNDPSKALVLDVTGY